MPIVRNSFIQMSKLSNVKGRINYISSHARQENLYAVYETTERDFWRELAKCNQEEFKKSGASGKCIEARELIIALPESFTTYDPNWLLKRFTDNIKTQYKVECVSALHHNKRKTNYHIHLIFSERQLLDETVEKIATRNMFYDENGKHVRTKKEILDEAGQLRKGCKIIPKGEIYERNIFTAKISCFKGEEFLDVVKQRYTSLINIYAKGENDRQKVFKKDGVYLPTKKIGKNNPMAEEIKEDNAMRKKWNQTVDRALVLGVPEYEIIDVKNCEIGQKAKESIQNGGRNPSLLRELIKAAITILEVLIARIFMKLLEERDRVRQREENAPTSITKPAIAESVPRPVRSDMAEKYLQLQSGYERLLEQSEAINRKEREISGLREMLAETKGIFKTKQRKELQEKIEEVERQKSSMERYLTAIAREYKYSSVKDFMADYRIAEQEYEDYKAAVDRWEQEQKKKNTQESGRRMPQESVREKLYRIGQEQKEEKYNSPIRGNRSSERGAR